MEAIENKIKKINFFLILIIPILLITGPFLADLTIITISLLFIFILKRDLFFDDFYKKFLKIFLIFYFSINLSSLLAENISQFQSFKVTLPYIRYLFYVSAVYIIFFEKETLFDYVSKSTVVIILIFFLDSLMQKILGHNILNYEISDTGRVSSFFNDELIMGGFICKIFPLGVIYFIRNKKKILFLFYLIITFVTIALSQERTSLILFFLSAILIFICIKELRKHLKYMILIFPIIIFVMFINKDNFNRLYKVTYYQLILTKGKTPIFSEVHENHYKTALNLFKSKPLFGHGIKTFRVLCAKEQYSVEKDIIKNSTLISKFDDQIFIYKDKLWTEWNKVEFKNNNFKFYYGPADISYFKNGDYVKKGDLLVKYKIYKKDGCSSHPHNYIMQLLSETGIISFLIFIFLYLLNIIFLFKMIINKNFRLNKDKIIILHIMIIINFFSFLPTGSFYNNWLSILNFYPLGILFAQYRLK